MRYIDADKIIYTWLTDANGKEHDGVTLQSVIDAQPTADVRKNVRGKWIKRIDHLDYGLIEFEGFECSLCGVKIWKDDYENVEFKFCPNCGADMRGEQCE